MSIPTGMGRLDRLPGINDANTTRRNAVVGGMYALAGCVTIGVLSGDGSDDDGDASENRGEEVEEQDLDEESEEDDEPEIAFEDDWFGPVTEEHNPETFDPDEDLDTVVAWVDETVEFLEFVFLDLDIGSEEEWVEAGERADELDDQFVEGGMESMFSRIVEDGNIADGLPAWDYDFAVAVGGQDGLQGAVLDVRTAASMIEEESDAAESFVRSAAETIELALIALEEADRYDYDAPEEVGGSQ